MLSSENDDFKFLKTAKTLTSTFITCTNGTGLMELFLSLQSLSLTRNMNVKGPTIPSVIFFKYYFEPWPPPPDEIFWIHAWTFSRIYTVTRFFRCNIRLILSCKEILVSWINILVLVRSILIKPNYAGCSQVYLNSTCSRQLEATKSHLSVGSWQVALYALGWPRREKTYLQGCSATEYSYNIEIYRL